MTTRPSDPILFAMTHSLPGGLREIWNDIADGLTRRGVEVARFVFYPAPGVPPSGPDISAWHHVTTRRPRSAIGTLQLLIALVRHLRQVRPRAIVTAMPAANVVVPIVVTLMRLPTRVFVSHHSPTGTHNRLLDRLDGWTGSLPCVKAVISVSDAVAASLAHKPARYRRKRCTIHNALPERIERLIDTLPRTGRAVESGNQIVALGRLTAQKNYPMLLRALALVPNAALQIGGAGEDEAELRALASDLGVTNRVRFAGLMSREDALALAASADIFAQLSLYEGHSLALIEAARLGLPLVVCDVPVQVEAITAGDGTRCGIAVPLGDVECLARHLSRLIVDPDARMRWSRLARRIAAEASNKDMIDRYETLLAPAAQRA